MSSIRVDKFAFNSANIDNKSFLSVSPFLHFKGLWVGGGLPLSDCSRPGSAETLQELTSLSSLGNNKSLDIAKVHIQEVFSLLFFMEGVGSGRRQGTYVEIQS